MDHRIVINSPLFNIKLYLDNLNKNLPFEDTKSFKLTLEQYKGNKNKAK